MDNQNREINLYLAQPRGFCAGVRRAISLVEDALSEFGAPVYVRHEIVHNKHVIEDLKRKGVIFIDDFTEIEDKNRPVIFSAHGVSMAVEQEAKTLGLKTIDATCPLVSKVHKQIQSLSRQKCEIIVIGKPNHVEIIGTIGQLNDLSKVNIINSIEDAKNLNLDKKAKIGFVTQTTLSVDDTDDITNYLKSVYPTIETMKKDDICFATTNRQKVVKEMAEKIELLLVIGSKNSSNSKQLRETALKNGIKNALLIDDAGELDWAALKGIQNIGITAGASAPEHLVEDLVYQIKQHYDKIKINDVIVEYKNVNFKL